MRSLVHLLFVFCAPDSWCSGSRRATKSPLFSRRNLRFTVVKDANDKPIRAASVVLHPVNKDGSQAKGGFQLKTDGEGFGSQKAFRTARPDPGAGSWLSDVR